MFLEVGTVSITVRMLLEPKIIRGSLYDLTIVVVVHVLLC